MRGPGVSPRAWRLHSRCGSRLCPREGQAGFTLIELMVVLLIIAIMIAIAAPNFHGESIQNADQQAQGIAIEAAAQLQRVFASSASYQNVQPQQLGCASAACNTPADCPAGVTWNAYGINWIDCGIDDGSGCPQNDSNGTAHFAVAGGEGAKATNTVNVAAVISWNGCATWAPLPASNDSSVTVAVSASPPANDCWFITLHSAGPNVYGFFKSPAGTTSDCQNLILQWPENAPPYSSSADGFWYGGTGITITSPLPTNGFSADPQI